MHRLVITALLILSPLSPAHATGDLDPPAPPGLSMTCMIRTCGQQ